MDKPADLSKHMQRLEMLFAALAIRPHAFGRHQLGIVAEELQLTAEMMRADAGLHADQARRQVGESRLDLATRPFSAAARLRHADCVSRRGTSSYQY
jgi:hypothetical protein